MENRNYDLVIIGGGAAGLMAAALMAGKDCRVALLEKNEICGRKILLTGKGRCNITNARAWMEFRQHIHPDAAFFRPSFMNFSNKDVVEFFNSIGLATVEERGMRIFPASGSSADVRKALMSHIQRSSNVHIYHKREVLDVQKGFSVKALTVEGDCKMDVEIFHARFVLIATGGLSYYATGSTGDGYKFARNLGHSIVPTFPSLTALVPARRMTKLNGLILKNVGLDLEVDGGVVQREFGEMAFTSGGIEGALGFRVSRRAVQALDDGKKVALVIDTKPALTLKDVKGRVEREYVRGVSMTSFLKKFLPVQLITTFIDSNPSLNFQNLPVKLKCWRIPIISYVGYQRAVITAGGVSLNEVLRKTMESKLQHGLYFAGEVLDLDADTGGYNLQIAFSTAATAVKDILAKRGL